MVTGDAALRRKDSPVHELPELRTGLFRSRTWTKWWSES
jgi:hypothetical protein